MERGKVEIRHGEGKEEIRHGEGKMEKEAVRRTAVAVWTADYADYTD
ncbi:MAG: hypothetical protein AB9882_12055 [Ignavibacteriaceae bacterium]